MTWFRRKRKIEKITIFYCWQSDIPGQREMIREELLAQAYHLEAENDCHVEVDEDTRGVAGMIPIADTVLEKIRNADIFVCDISPVATIYRKNEEGYDIPGVEKKMPNSNVMLELGYALRCMHSSRIIALANTQGYKWHDGEMPFDIFDRQYIKFTDKEDLDLSRPLNLSFNFVKKFGRVDENGYKWVGRLKRMFGGSISNEKLGMIIPATKESIEDEECKKMFSSRLSLAFPGVDDKHYNASDAVNRLKVLFDNKEMQEKRMLVLEDNRGYSNPIDCFEVIDKNTVLIGHDVLEIMSLEVKRKSNANSGSEIEISVLPMSEVQYDEDFQDNSDYAGLDQYYSIYTDETGKEHILTRQLHEDKAAFKKDGSWISLGGKTQLRRIQIYSTTMFIRAKKIRYYGGFF